MKILVTGSSGHLGEGLIRTFQSTQHQVVGLDILASPFTDHVGSIIDRDIVRQCLQGIDAVIHTATLHKPHLATHSRQDFVDTNITGTLNLLEEAVLANVRAFVFTSTTSAFGQALTPPPGRSAIWVTEDVQPVPKNTYGVTKTAAEDLCQMFHSRHGLPCLVLRTSRFFSELDDDPIMRDTYEDANAKANEYLYRRVDLQDTVEAHLLALAKAPLIGFQRYIISATTPFQSTDMTELRRDAPRIVSQRVPEYEAEFARRGWTMFPSIDRVYVNERARRDLEWQPQYDFQHIIKCLMKDDEFRSPLARAVGAKGYHDREFSNGPYPTV